MQILFLFQSLEINGDKCLQKETWEQRELKYSSWYFCQVTGNGDGDGKWEWKGTASPRR